jgi:hypothetical protein
VTGKYFFETPAPQSILIQPRLPRGLHRHPHLLRVVRVLEGP